MNKTIEELNKKNIHIPKVKNKKFLQVIQAREGEVVYCEEEDAIYSFNNNEWQELKQPEKAPSVGVPSYEIMKSLADALDKMNNKEIQEKKELIIDWKKQFKDRFFMLLGKEISYYTIFEHSAVYEVPNLAEGVIECLENLGDILYIEENNDRTAIEIWIRQNNQEPTILYLFPYGHGVVQIGG